MIVRADTATSFLIEFTNGVPDGSITWILRGPAGTVLTNGTIVVPVGALSTYLRVDATYNHLDTGELTSFRDVEWTYNSGGAVVNGEARYSVEARVPFGASTSGVRAKLGIDDPVDLPDHDISLVTAFSQFPSTASISATSIVMKDAIEAQAALNILPTLTVRLAKKEDSGTSSFQRQDIDWETLGASLADKVTAGLLEIDPNYDATAGFPAIFILAPPAVDPFTGVAL